MSIIKYINKVRYGTHVNSRKNNKAIATRNLYGLSYEKCMNNGHLVRSAPSRRCEVLLQISDNPTGQDLAEVASLFANTLRMRFVRLLLLSNRANE